MFKAISFFYLLVLGFPCYFGIASNNSDRGISSQDKCSFRYFFLLLSITKPFDRRCPNVINIRFVVSRERILRFLNALNVTLKANIQFLHVLLCHIVMLCIVRFNIVIFFLVLFQFLAFDISCFHTVIFTSSINLNYIFISYFHILHCILS